MNLLSGAEIWCSLSVLERICIVEVFLKKYNENFVKTLETVCNIELSIFNREVSILRGSTVV